MVPFPAGGTADILPRVVAAKLRDSRFPAGVVIENRTGAMRQYRRRIGLQPPPDGVTLPASPPAPIAINQHPYRKLSFDPAKWVPVTMIATVPNVLVVNPKLPVRSVPELIRLPEGEPRQAQLRLAGQRHHLAPDRQHVHAVKPEPTWSMSRTRARRRRWSTWSAELVTTSSTTWSSSLPFHQSGGLRILAIADEQRAQVLPDVPTFAEQKLPAMNAVTWFALVAPPGTRRAPRCRRRRRPLPTHSRCRMSSGSSPNRGAEPRG